MDIGDDNLIAVARECGDRLNEALAEHDRVLHYGTRCADERVNVLAYLLHRFGMPNDDATWNVFLQQFVARALDYQAYHVEHEHAHDV